MRKLIGWLLFLTTLRLHPSAAQERVTLRLVDWADLDEIPLQEEAIAEFKRLHPSIDILYEPNPGRQYEQKLLTALAADAPPDVFLLDSKLIPSFTNKKILLDLMGWLEPLAIDTSQWFGSVMNIARRGDALYAFPKGFTPLVMYYNKTLLRASGLPPPPEDWTWDDYLSYAHALTRDTDHDGTADQYGTVFVNYYFYWIPWVWSAGGDVVGPDGTASSGFLNSNATEEALQFLIDLRTRHRVSPDIGSWAQAGKTGATQALFINGNVGMMVDGHWRMPKFLQYIREGTLDIGVAPLPRHSSGRKVNVMYESGWCVPVGTRHRREAVILAAFMAGETASRIRASRQLEIPATVAVAREVVEADPTGLERAFVREVEYCRQPWGSRLERFTEIEWVLQDAVDEVMVNQKPMRETMTAYAARIDATLAGIRSNERFDFRPIREHSEILRFLVGVILVLVCAALILYFRTARRDRRHTAVSFSFLAPSLLHLAVFVFTPIVFSAYLSMHRWDIVVAEKPLIGTQNFGEMLSDPSFWNALRNTLLYTLNVPLGMTVSLSVALLLNRRLAGLGFLRTLYFLPSVTSFVAIALVWIWIYHPTFGVANYVLSTAGLPPLQWLNSSQTAMVSIIIFSIWLGVGYQMVIFLAGLQGIPEELYEAARIDGAGRWRLFRSITWPLLRPTTFFILVTSMIASFQVFTSVYIMTTGGPVGSTDVIVYHIYQAAWEQLRMGYASAMSWVLFIIVMIATWAQFKLLGRTVDYT